MEDVEEEINLNNPGVIIKDENTNKENGAIFDKFKAINNTENNDDILLEYYKSKHSSSEDSFEIYEPLFKTKPEIIQNNILNIPDKQNNYSCREKKYSKLLKNYNISNYNLDFPLFKKYRYTKEENDTIESNKILNSYSFKHQKDKINQIFSYILKNSKKTKINKKYKEKSSDEKYIPTRNKINNEFDNGNINILDTLKIHLDNKTKEMINSRNNNNIKIIQKEKHISHKNKFVSNKKYNHHIENKNKLKSNLKKANINTQKVKKENIHLKNDVDLAKFVHNKIRQKNSYYIIKLKNKSYIYKINKSKKIKTKEKEKDRLDINKIKEDNIKIRFKNIKLKKNFELIEKELNLLKNKNKELKNEIIKKEILIQKYEHQINEDKNKIQNLTKKLSENKMNYNIKNLIYQKEIELFFINNNNAKTNKKHFNLQEIEKNIELNFEKEKNNKKFFDDILSISKAKELNFILNKEKEKFNFVISNSQEINYIKIKQAEKDNNKLFEIIKINDIYFEKTKKKEIKSFNQNLSKENILDFNIIKEKNIKTFESKKLSLQTIEICQILFSNSPKKISNLVISEQIIISILKDPKKLCNLVISDQKILSFIKLPKKIINFIISEHEILSILKLPKKKSNLTISEHKIVSFISKDIIHKNILKIIKLDFFSFDRINNINKFKNIEASKNNISLYYKATIPKNNNSENNKNNNINNDANLIPNTDKIQFNNNLKNSEEKKEESNKNDKNEEKSEKFNRAINRIRRKNQSIMPDSNLINSDEYLELQKYRAKGRSDTVRVGRSGRILDIAKKLEMQMNNNEDNTNKKIEAKKKENSNLVEIISTQPIIKNKKKKKKINFEFDG